MRFSKRSLRFQRCTYMLVAPLPGSVCPLIEVVPGDAFMLSAFVPNEDDVNPI
jgi:hypothetical protein